MDSFCQIWSYNVIWTQAFILLSTRVYAGWMNAVLLSALFISVCGPIVDFGLGRRVAYV